MGSIPVTACSSKLDPLPPLDQPAKSKTPPGYPGSLFTSIRFQGMAASKDHERVNVELARDRHATQRMHNL